MKKPFRLLFLLTAITGALGFSSTPALGTPIDWAAYDPQANGTYEFEGSFDGFAATVELHLSEVGKVPGTYTIDMVMSIPALYHYESTIIEVKNGVYDPSELISPDVNLDFDVPPPEDLELRRGSPIDWSSPYRYEDYERSQVRGRMSLHVAADEEVLHVLPLGSFRAQPVSVRIETEESWEENEFFYGGTLWLGLNMEMAFLRGVGPALIEFLMVYEDSFGDYEQFSARFELVRAPVPLALATIEGEAIHQLWGEDTQILHGWFWNPRQGYFWAWADGWIYQNGDHYWATGTSDNRHSWQASTGNWYFESKDHFPWIYGYTEQDWITR